MYAAQAGSVRVFGIDPVADPPAVLGRIGFMSEDADLPDWMLVGELLRYTAAFYPKWDQAMAEKLCAEFGLGQGMRVSALSRGLRARAALVTALAHRPELLVLDEPSSGLDPLARRDILTAVIRAASGEGQTVLFSSHLLDEVERVADRLALIDNGRLSFEGEMEAVRGRHRRLTLHFNEPRSSPPALDGVLSWQGGGREWTALFEGDPLALHEKAKAEGGRVVEEAQARLEEVFAAHAGGRRS
jgi:ABC-2 type transport system ATP-binding protein